MTRDELRKELKTGVKLEDIFEFTDGQDCLIYKGKFLPGIIGDDICYIPDIFLNEIPVNRPVSESEIDDIINECFTTNDFINECKGHENIAEDLFNAYKHKDKIFLVMYEMHKWNIEKVLLVYTGSAFLPL